MTLFHLLMGEKWSYWLIQNLTQKQKWNNTNLTFWQIKTIVWVTWTILLCHQPSWLLFPGFAFSARNSMETCTFHNQWDVKSESHERSLIKAEGISCQILIPGNDNTAVQCHLELKEMKIQCTGWERDDCVQSNSGQRSLVTIFNLIF